MLQFAVLGSGSSGNSAVVCHDSGTRILVDAGLSARQLCLRLQTVGIDPDSIDAIVLTHEHNDHCGGLDVFCRKRETPLPVYATDHTCELVREKLTRSRETIAFHRFEAGQGFSIGGMKIESFTVPHDAVDPVGFVFRGQHSSLGVLSDVGHVTELIRNRLQAVDSLFVEANYDEIMLQNDIKRPWQTKQRISSRHGHLSNDQTAELVASVASEKLCRVVLGHLSDDCNTPETACRAISDCLCRHDFRSVEVRAAERRNPLPLCDAARQNRNPYPIDEAPRQSDRIRETGSHHSEPRHQRSESCAQPLKVEQSEWAF